MYQVLWLKLKLFITTRSRAVRWTTVVLMGIFVIFGLGVFVHPAHAGVVDCLTSPVDCAGDVISTFLLWIASIIGKILVVLIDILLGIIQYNDFVRSAAVSKGWVVIRDLCNMFFVAVLLIIAFGTILRIESYKYQRLLPQLIIMAVLINFSKLIAGFLIDVSQVVLLTFANAFKDSAAGNFTNVFQLKTMLDFIDPLHPDATLGFWQKIGVAGFAIIMLLVASFVMVAMIVVFLARIVYLWILVVLSPLAYLLAVVPAGKQYSSKWWSTFGRWLTTGPILAFFIWLSLSVLGTGTGGSPAAVITLSEGQGEAVNAGLNNAGLSAGLGTNSSSQNMLGFMLAVAMLVMAMGFAQALGGFAGKWTGNVMGRLQKLGSTGLKVAGAPLAGLGSLAKSQGRRARRWYEDKTPAIMQPWNLAKGAKARGEKLDTESRTAAAAKGREAWERFVTGGKIKVPYVDQVESGFEAQFAKDYSLMDKEEKAEAMRGLWERNIKNPGNTETKRRMRALMRVAAQGGHLDDIMQDKYFKGVDENGNELEDNKAAMWTDPETGERRKGFYDRDTKEFSNRASLNRFFRAAFGDDQQGMRLVSEIEDIGKAQKHQEYGGHVTYDPNIKGGGKYVWKRPEENDRALSELSKVSARTSLGDSPHEFVGLREKKRLVGDREGLIVKDGKAIFTGEQVHFDEKEFQGNLKKRLLAMKKSGEAELIENADGSVNFKKLGGTRDTTGGEMSAFNEAAFVRIFGDQPHNRINEHAQTRTASYMLGGDREKITEEGAIVGDDVDKERIQKMLDEWAQAPIAFWKKIGASGMLKFQKVNYETGELEKNSKGENNVQDVFHLIEEDARKNQMFEKDPTTGKVVYGADGKEKLNTEVVDRIKEVHTFYNKPENASLSEEEMARVKAIGEKYGFKEEKKEKGNETPAEPSKLVNQYGRPLDSSEQRSEPTGRAAAGTAAATPKEKIDDLASQAVHPDTSRPQQHAIDTQVQQEMDRVAPPPAALNNPEVQTVSQHLGELTERLKDSGLDAQAVQKIMGDIHSEITRLSAALQGDKKMSDEFVKNITTPLSQQAQAGSAGQFGINSEEWRKFIYSMTHLYTYFRDKAPKKESGGK